MKDIPDKSIDLTLTSPPYDKLRTYNDTLIWDENIWKQVIKQLFRITKIGGIVVWVVNDATINGSETLTSFKQAIYFREVGFNVHDTMIWIKKQLAFPDENRYYGAFEYMFILSKGKPKSFNPICDKENVSFGEIVHSTERKKDGSLRKRKSGDGKPIKKYGVRWNYWLIHNQSRGEHSKHPATFPMQLAHDHIISWSDKNDVVLDCFMGSGTTGIACKKLGRNFIGIEKDKKYFSLAENRILQA
jgi:site-specific DNA-methyltransferase (adenine-specific)